MDDKIIATFCLCDDLLKAMHHQEDRPCQRNDAAIMTTALIASLCFRGNHESARSMLKQHGYIPDMLSKSRFSRRLHRIKDLFIILFDLLGQTWKTLNTDAIYVIDSMPIQKPAEDHGRQSVGECQKLKRITSFRVPRASARGYLLLYATIFVFGDQRYTPRKIFEAIKPARNGVFMDARFI